MLGFPYKFKDFIYSAHQDCGKKNLAKSQLLNKYSVLLSDHSMSCECLGFVFVFCFGGIWFLGGFNFVLLGLVFCCCFVVGVFMVKKNREEKVSVHFT